MTENAAKFLEAITTAGGDLAAIDRVELELLDRARCRWTLWAGQRRLYSAVARPDDLGPMLASTRVLLDLRMAGPPAARRQH